MDTHAVGARRQLTVRAVVSGMLLGALLCLSNLYVVLKTGWSLGVTITACVMAYALFRALYALGITRTEFGVLENNAMGSVASAAGFMTGGGNMAALPALLMLTGLRPGGVSMFFWFALIAALGVFVGIPVKRQLINKEQLPFPTGTATAETLRAMHDHGSGSDKARLLLVAAVIGTLIAWLRDAKAPWMPFNIPHAFSLPLLLAGIPLAQWTLAAEGSLILVGGGALISFRTGWSMLLGALITYGLIGPRLYETGIIGNVSYRTVVGWTLWPGAGILVSSGLMALFFEWRAIAKSLSSVTALFRRTPAADDPADAVEAPQSWFVGAFLVLGPPIVYLMHRLFEIPIWAGVIALPLAVVLGIIASRVTGETDVTPTKALGPVTQAVYGMLLPGKLVPNIMSANVTGGIGLHAADLLLDLKSGHLLGANPRQQLIGQLFGVLAGAAVVVPAFNLLVPSADILGSEQFPAPSVQVWASVSKVFSTGLEGLAPSAQWAALAGVALGIVLSLNERYGRKRAKRFLPSASGFGMAFVMPGYNSVSFFLGALIAEVLRRRKPAFAARTVVTVASGFIAGESLMGILIAMLIAFGVLGK